MVLRGFLFAGPKSSPLEPEFFWKGFLSLKQYPPKRN